MRRFYRFILIAVSTLLLFSAVSADTEKAPAPKAYVLIEAETCTVLEAENENMRINAGYLTKLMSILVIAEQIEQNNIPLTDELTASESVTGTKGSVIWLESGDKLSADELLKSVIVGNANDALTVLAEYVSGDIDTFVMDMNAKAFDLGLRDTYYCSPYGYYDSREYTTAHDIAVVCAELTKYDFLAPYFKIWRDFVKNGQIELVSENSLTRTFEQHIGFKACHSDEIGYCAAEGGTNSHGCTFIAVVIGAADEDSSLGTAKKLVKGGFSKYRIVTAEFPEEMLVPLKVNNGTEKAVEIGLRAQGKVAIPKGTGELWTKAVIPEYLTAPVYPEQPVGTIGFYNDGVLVFETDIITKSSIDKLTLWYVLKQTLSNIIEK